MTPEFDGLWEREEIERPEIDTPKMEILTVLLSEYELSYIDANIETRKIMLAEDHEWSISDDGRFRSKDGHIEVSIDRVFYVFGNTLIPIMESDIDDGDRSVGIDGYAGVFLDYVDLCMEDFNCKFLEESLTPGDYPDYICKHPNYCGKFCRGFNQSCSMRVRQ